MFALSLRPESAAEPALLQRAMGRLHHWQMCGSSVELILMKSARRLRFANDRAATLSDGNATAMRRRCDGDAMTAIRRRSDSHATALQPRRYAFVHVCEREIQSDTYRYALLSGMHMCMYSGQKYIHIHTHMHCQQAMHMCTYVHADVHAC